jgi:uncharacterized protein YuzE
MKVVFDRASDTLTITLREGDIVDSDEVRPGFIADFDSEGHVLRFELLDATHSVTDPNAFEYQAVESA